MKTKAHVNWTSTGNLGITWRGWAIVRLVKTTGEWDVFDDRDRHVGRYATRDEAEAAAR
jgi:hypothetical protein